MGRLFLSLLSTASPKIVVYLWGAVPKRSDASLCFQPLRLDFVRQFLPISLLSTAPPKMVAYPWDAVMSSKKNVYLCVYCLPNNIFEPRGAIPMLTKQQALAAWQ